MPDPISILPCPDCGVKLKVPLGRAVRCPKCSATVRAPAASAPAAVRPAKPVRPAKRQDPDALEEVEPLEEVEEERPRPKRRRDEEEDERPRSRRRREEEDDEDDRARRRREEDDDYRPKRRKRRDNDEGPWLIAAASGVGCFLLMFLGAFLVNGMRGVVPSQDGYAVQVGGLAMLVILGLILIPAGVIGVKYKRTYDRWGWVIEGTMAVVVGFIQSVGGGLLGGFALYGLITTLVNGR